MKALLMANLMILGVAQWLPDGHQDRSNNTFVHCHWNNLDVGMTWKRPCVFIVCEVKSTKSRLEEYHVGYELMEVDALKGEGKHRGFGSAKSRGRGGCFLCGQQGHTQANCSIKGNVKVKAGTKAKQG